MSKPMVRFTGLIIPVLLGLLGLQSLSALEHPGLGELNDRSSPIFVGEDRFRQRIEVLAGDEEPLGILLSGGSARAYAHIGVLQRLEEADIVPDFIVANSMGAIVAMLYAAGLSPQDIESLISSTPLTQLFQPELPLGGGILDPAGFMDVLYNLFGDIRIEDLPIPIIIVCDDLVTKRQVWFAEGDFYTVMRAAFAMPVYFDPVKEKEFRLVDGGTTNLIPVNIPATFTKRMIVAATFYRGDHFNYRNPLTILNINFGIGKERSGIETIQQFKPFLIRCDVEDISFMDYANLSVIIKRGYDSADRLIGDLTVAIGKNPRDLTAERSEASEKLAATQKRMTLNQGMYRKEGRLSAKASLLFPESYGSRNLLLDSPLFSFGISAGKGYTWGEIAEATNLDEINPTGLLRLKTGPFGPLDIAFMGLINGDIYYAQGEGTFKFLIRNTHLSAFISSERVLDDKWSASDSYDRSGIRLDSRSSSFRDWGAVYAFARGDDTLGWGAEAGFAWMPLYPGEIRMRGMGRQRLAGEKQFPLFEIDGYRGYIPEDTDIPHGVATVELALNLNRLTQGFAETLLVQRFDTALFCDLLGYGKKGDYAIATGVSCTTIVSLIGLKPFSLSLSGAWDLMEEEAVVILRLGSLF